VAAWRVEARGSSVRGRGRQKEEEELDKEIRSALSIAPRGQAIPDQNPKFEAPNRKQTDKLKSEIRRQASRQDADNAKKPLLLTGENRENGVFKSSLLSPLPPVKKSEARRGSSVGCRGEGKFSCHSTLFLLFDHLELFRNSDFVLRICPLSPWCPLGICDTGSRP
jgi:hypothetical protein